MAVGMYFFSQRFYRIAYEWSKVGKILVLTAAVFLIFRFLQLEPLNILGIILKTALVISFTFGLIMMKIIDTKEIAEVKMYIKKYFRNSRNPISKEGPSDL